MHPSLLKKLTKARDNVAAAIEMSHNDLELQAELDGVHETLLRLIPRQHDANKDGYEEG